MVRKRIYTPSQDRPDKPNVCIVITDGSADEDAVTPANELRSIKGTAIFAVGVRRNYDKAELEKITGNARNVFTADFKDLDSSVAEKIRQSFGQSLY